MLKLGRVLFVIGLAFVALAACNVSLGLVVSAVSGTTIPLQDILLGPSLCLLCGLVLVVLGLIAAYSLRLLKGDDVIESWSILIAGGQGKAEEVYRNTYDFLVQTLAPDLKIERKMVEPSAIRGYLGEKREFLVITDARRLRFRPYKLFVNAGDYGDNLQVAWYLTFYPGFWRLVLAVIPFVNIAQFMYHEMDLFDQQDLFAYVTNTHHAVLAAVDKLLLELNQDPSKIDRKSRGFLGISG